MPLHNRPVGFLIIALACLAIGLTGPRALIAVSALFLVLYLALSLSARAAERASAKRRRRP